MYVSAQIGGHRHLGRQRFPDGQPQQITFGPTDEETVACTPDGHSLLTSLGREQGTIWLHAAGSERVLTTESHAFSPWLSPDADRVYFLSARSSIEPSELWRVEVASGRKQSLLTGFAISGYYISPGEQRVAFAVSARRQGTVRRGGHGGEFSAARRYGRIAHRRQRIADSVTDIGARHAADTPSRVEPIDRFRSIGLCVREVGNSSEHLSHPAPQLNEPDNWPCRSSFYYVNPPHYGIFYNL